MKAAQEGSMKVRKVIRKRVRHESPGSQVNADINAVVAANVNEPGSRNVVRSRSRIVQRSGTSKETSRKPSEGGEQDG
jgi:hypothetical protein